MKTDYPYQEAMRYVVDARKLLKLVDKDGKFYVDDDYIKKACKTAYNGMLKALDFLFDIKDVPKKRGRKSYFYYEDVLSELNPVLNRNLHTAYLVLYLDGSKGNLNSIRAINAGIECVVDIINALKPYSKNGMKSKHK